MATLTKIDMIKELISSKKVDDLKREKENPVAFAKRLFESLPKTRVEKMYRERIGAIEPEVALEDVTKKVKNVIKTVKKAVEKTEVSNEPEIEKVVKKAKKKKQPKRSPEEAAKYVPALDEKGREYKKAWILNVLNDTGFSSMNRNKRTLQGEFYTIVYNHEKYRLDVFDPRLAGVSVAYTLCLCECMVKGFIKNYSSTKKAIKPLPKVKKEEAKIEPAPKKAEKKEAKPEPKKAEKSASKKVEPKAEKKVPTKKAQKEAEKPAVKKAIKTKETTATKKAAAKKK